MNRFVSVVGGAVVLIVLRVDARACEPLARIVHTVDASMKATDQTPPILPAIPSPMIHVGTGDSQGGCGGSKCTDGGSVAIAVAATDDMTPPEKIGYRLFLAAGSLPPGLTLPMTAVDAIGGTIGLSFDPDIAQLDFTLQVFAVDLAGNESAPQTVRVMLQLVLHPACTVTRDRASPTASLALLAALVVAAAVRRRRIGMNRVLSARAVADPSRR